MQKQHSRILLRALPRGRMIEMHREPEVSEAKVPSGRMSRWPCKGYLKGTCTNSFCDKWYPPECLFYKSESGCRFGEKCSHAHRQVEEQPNKDLKRMVIKSAVALLTRNEQLQRRETCCGRLFIKYTKTELRESRNGTAEVFDIAEELKHTETNPMCKIQKNRRKSC